MLSNNVGIVHINLMSLVFHNEKTNNKARIVILVKYHISHNSATIARSHDEFYRRLWRRQRN